MPLSFRRRFHALWSAVNSRTLTPGRGELSTLRCFHQRYQFVAIMFELLVADAGDAAELLRSRWARCRDAVDRGVVQHDVGRHATLARHLGTPGPERADQIRIAGFSPAAGQL